ncbi:MAG: alpha-amylase family glycosyl hydrolase [Accumulibacter sp.]|uniref:carbohydrate-binding module family 20 domain-containing protein n=1 Tax=Accumulibacter sp. TaxID=2053492 RepID=UPI002FC31CA2
MGTPGDLQRMIGTCHDAGVRVFADVVVNRMATDAGIAADGPPSNAVTLTDHYFSANDFHTDGGPISDADCTSPARRGEVMHCRLEGMPDLAVERSHVQGQVANHLCRLLEMGVDGFRIDAAKHMPAGTYCNVIDATRDANGRTCGGTRVVVDVHGQGDIAVPAGGANVPAVAIDTGQPIGGGATCTLTFIVTGAGTAWGQSLYVVGNQAGVGNWSAGNGFALTIRGTGADAPWSDRISLPAATAVQYKHAKWDGTGAVWECDQASASGHREFTSCASGAQARADGPFAR